MKNCISFSIVLGLCVCLLGGARLAKGAGSAFVTLSDHDPFLPQFDGTVNGNGYIFLPQTLHTPVLEPGVAFLNGISGGSSAGANGNVSILDPYQGQPSMELVAVAAQVTMNGISESLTRSGDAAVVANDINNAGTFYEGDFPVTAYVYSQIPPQYEQAAMILSAGESAIGGHPFDLLLASTVSATVYGTSQFWDFGFAGETGAGAPFTSFTVTDVGVVPEPSSSMIAVGLSIGLFARRPKRGADHVAI